MCGHLLVFHFGVDFALSIRKEMRLDFMSQNTPNRVRFEWGDFPHRMLKKKFKSQNPKQDEDFFSFLTNYLWRFSQ